MTETIAFPQWFLDTFGIPPFQLSVDQRCEMLRRRIEQLETAERERVERLESNRYARHPPINWTWVGMYHQEWCNPLGDAYPDCYCGKVIVFERGQVPAQGLLRGFPPPCDPPPLFR